MPERSNRQSLDELANRDDVTVSGDFTIKPRELPAERSSRLKQEEAEAAHRRLKELIILSFVLGGITLIGLRCLIIAFRAGPSEEKGKWAMALLGMIVSAGVGFLGGKAQK